MRTNNRPKLLPPLALLRTAPAAQPHRPGTLSPLELRTLVADLIG